MSPHEPAERLPRQATASGPILVALSDGPKTIEEIEDAFRGFGRRLPHDPRPYFARRQADTKLRAAVSATLATSTSAGWTREQDGRYALTERGAAEAKRLLARARARTHWVHRTLQPVNAARNSMLAQVAITAIKVPAALLSGSIAQLNDAAEEVLDVVGSGIVLIGTRSGRERLANIIVIALILATGCFTLVMAVRRLFVAVTPTVSWYPLTVAALSVPYYVVRSLYERTAGARAGNAALVTQSVDSRNHAIVAATVVIGLLSVASHMNAVDTAIGVGVAMLICKSGLGLAYDFMRTMRTGTQPDLGRYSLWVTERAESIVRTRVETWVLYLIDREHVTNRADLVCRVTPAVDRERNPLLREIGMELDTPDTIDPVLDTLHQRGWLTGDVELALTAAGRTHLRRTLRLL